MITTEEVTRLASLSKIKLTEGEVADLTKDLGKILDYVLQLKEVDVSQVQAQPTPMGGKLWREDENAHPSGQYTEDLLSAAPDRSGDYFKVKKIL